MKTKELLSIITKENIDKEFGEPFIRTFAVFLNENGKKESIVATGVTCSLFLSCLKLKYPTDKLNTFVRNIREETPFITFDCKSYEQLYRTMQQHTHILLLDKHTQYRKTEMSKEDIFEAFDFITNN